MASQATAANRARPHWWTFLGEFLKAPLAVASPFASSTSMAEHVLGSIDWQRAKRVVEYGPGTGTFTRHILRCLPSDGCLIVIESEKGLADYLADTLPDPRLQVVHGSAIHAITILRERGMEQVDYILSGLPFSSLSESERRHVVRQSADLLEEDGQFLAYQVRRSVEAHLDAVFGQVLRSRYWRNIPPCHLYWAQK